jgi:hypothetical protein
MADHKKAHIMSNEVTRQEALDALKIVDTPPEERFDRISRLAQQVFGVETVAISLIDHDRQWFKSRIGTNLTEGKRRDAFCDFTIRGSEILEVSDATKDPRFSSSALVVGDPHIRFYAGHPLETPSGENIGTLCLFDPKPRVFTEEERNLLRDLALWVQKEMTIQDEFKRAAQVQQGLLPRTQLILQGFDVAGGCAQTRTVGGDFYDWYPVDEGEAFNLADVMGKGMSAAIIAATVRAVLRAGSRSDDIVTAVEIAAATLEGDLNNAGSFVTLFHARLNIVTGLVRFVDAGHGLSIVIRQHGVVERLSSDNPPLGAGSDINWTEQTSTLTPGDTLVSVSDGVLDLFDGTLAGLDKVAEIVGRCSTAQGIVDAVIALAGKNAADDVTILVLRRNPIIS